MLTMLKPRLSRSIYIPIRNFSLKFTDLTPLAVAFNSRPAPSNDQHSALKKDVGLFSIPQLKSHEGFYELKDNCIWKTNSLVSEALDKNRRRKMVQIFDELSDTLCRVADMAEFIRLAHPSKVYSEAAELACVTVSSIVETLNTNVDLYNALRHSYENSDVKSTTEVDKLVSRLFLFDFEQSGIHLPETKRKQVVILNDTILNIGQQFVSGSSKARFINRNELPNHIRNVFSGDAETAAVNALYADSADADVREIAYKIFLQPDEQQEYLLTRLLTARHQLAQLCGFRTYAERALRGSVMEDPEKVYTFLNIISEGIRDQADQDFNVLRDMKLSHDPRKRDLAPWDVSYFTQKAKNKIFEVSLSDYSPYFSLGSCMEGLNIVFNECFGISLVNSSISPGEVWAPDVYKLAVMHEIEGCLGYIYCDFYERPGKPNQDCHFTIRGGKLLEDGTYQKPIVVLMLNFQPPRWQCPSLLMPSMVDNLFHEMGHAMHSMLARTEYQHVTGTRCCTDLAEVPSILMEYFASDPRIIRTFARHFQTKEPLPENVIQKLCASKRLFSASETQLQVFYAALDHVYHGQFPLSGSTTKVFEEVQGKFYGLPIVPNTAWQLRFSHLVGYGAKYYSYLVSKALASSIWKRCFEEDPLNRFQGDRYRREFLAHGGGKDPKTLVGDFLEIAPHPERLAEFIVSEVDEYQHQSREPLKKLL